MADEIGATGAYPDGVLNKYDEGEIVFKIGVYKNNIFIDFGKPVHWVAFSSDEARNFAQYILSWADRLDAKNN